MRDLHASAPRSVATIPNRQQGRFHSGTGRIKAGNREIFLGAASFHNLAPIRASGGRPCSGRMAKPAMAGGGFDSTEAAGGQARQAERPACVAVRSSIYLRDPAKPPDLY